MGRTVRIHRVCGRRHRPVCAQYPDCIPTGYIHSVCVIDLLYLVIKRNGARAIQLESSDVKVRKSVRDQTKELEGWTAPELKSDASFTKPRLQSYKRMREEQKNYQREADDESKWPKQWLRQCRDTTI